MSCGKNILIENIEQKVHLRLYYIIITENPFATLLYHYPVARQGRTKGLRVQK